MDALTNVCSKQTVNPIKAMLETCHDNWDGNKHVENLLPMMLGARWRGCTILAVNSTT